MITTGCSQLLYFHRDIVNGEFPEPFFLLPVLVGWIMHSYGFRYTGCSLNIVFFLKMLWFFLTLQVLLLQRWCLTCHCVHTLTPRGNRERPEYEIYFKSSKKHNIKWTPCISVCYYFARKAPYYIIICMLICEPYHQELACGSMSTNESFPHSLSSASPSRHTCSVVSH